MHGIIEGGSAASARYCRGYDTSMEELAKSQQPGMHNKLPGWISWVLGLLCFLDFPVALIMCLVTGMDWDNTVTDITPQCDGYNCTTPQQHMRERTLLILVQLLCLAIAVLAYYIVNAWLAPNLTMRSRALISGGLFLALVVMLTAAGYGITRWSENPSDTAMLLASLIVLSIWVPYLLLRNKYRYYVPTTQYVPPAKPTKPSEPAEAAKPTEPAEPAQEKPSEAPEGNSQQLEDPQHSSEASNSERPA